MIFKKERSSLGFGIVLTLFAYVLFAICGAFVRGLGKDIPTIEIIFFQSGVSLLLIIPTVFYHGVSKLKPVAIFPHAIRDFSGLISYFFYFLAIKYLGLIDATVLSYTAPFYIPFIWRIWTKEEIPKETFWAIALGFIGMVIILKPGTSIFSISSIIGILSGIFSALALAGVSMLNRKKELIRNTLFYFFLTATIISLPLAIASWKNPSIIQLGLLLGVGSFTFFAQIILTEAYKHGAASYLSPMSYSIIIYTSMISYFFFKQPPGWLTFIGILFVITGGTMTYLLRKKPKTVAEAFEANHIPKKPWWKFWKKYP